MAEPRVTALECGVDAESVLLDICSRGIREDVCPECGSGLNYEFGVGNAYCPQGCSQLGCSQLEVLKGVYLR